MHRLATASTSAVCQLRTHQPLLHGLISARNRPRDRATTLPECLAAVRGMTGPRAMAALRCMARRPGRVGTNDCGLRVAYSGGTSLSAATFSSAAPIRRSCVCRSASTAAVSSEMAVSTCRQRSQRLLGVLELS